MITIKQLQELKETIIQEFKSLGFEVDLLNDYVFKIDGRSVQKAGSCIYSKRVITISKKAFINQTPRGIKNTMVHEMLHAITPRAEHGGLWLKYANDYNEAYGESVGIIKQNFNEFDLQLSESEKQGLLERTYKYTLICPDCGQKFYLTRKTGNTYVHGNGRCQGILIMRQNF